MDRVRSIPEITEEGTRALVRALGYPDAVRFITSLRPGRGDYTKDRRRLLKNLSLDEIIKQSRSITATNRKRRKRA